MEVEVFPEIFSNEEIRTIGIYPKQTFFIKELQPDMPAIKAGLQAGDQILSVDGIKIFSFIHLVDYLSDLEDGQEIALTVRKGGESGLEQTYNLSPIEKEIRQGNNYEQKKTDRFYSSLQNNNNISKPSYSNFKQNQRYVSYSDWSGERSV